MTLAKNVQSVKIHPPYLKEYIEILRMSINGNEHFLMNINCYFAEINNVLNLIGGD